MNIDIINWEKLLNRPTEHNAIYRDSLIFKENAKVAFAQQISFHFNLVSMLKNFV